MSISRKFIHLMLVLPLLIGVGAVSASPANSHEVVTSPASFTIPADQCPSLPAGVSISGEGASVAIINTRTLADGSTEIRISNLIKGTATDSNGGAHKFVYQNDSVETILLSGLHKISMSDSFVLSGPGPHYSVGFNWRWTYTPPDEPIFPPPAHDWEQISTRGDPLLCDPL